MLTFIVERSSQIWIADSKLRHLEYSLGLTELDIKGHLILTFNAVKKQNRMSVFAVEIENRLMLFNIWPRKQTGINSV